MHNISRVFLSVDLSYGICNLCFGKSKINMEMGMHMGRL